MEKRGSCWVSRVEDGFAGQTSPKVEGSAEVGPSVGRLVDGLTAPLQRAEPWASMLWPGHGWAVPGHTCIQVVLLRWDSQSGLEKETQ